MPGGGRGEREGGRREGRSTGGLWSHAHGHVIARQLMPGTKQVRFQCHAPDQECREFHASNGWARLPRAQPWRSGALPCKATTRSWLRKTRWPFWGTRQAAATAGRHRQQSPANGRQPAAHDGGLGPQHISCMPRSGSWHRSSASLPAPPPPSPLTRLGTLGACKPQQTQRGSTTLL